MMATKDEAKTLIIIEHTYVPFLKKIIVFLEKSKKVSAENVKKLKAIYTIFTAGSCQEKIEAFHVNQTKLEKWYNKFKKNKHTFLSSEEPSQGALEGEQQLPMERQCTFVEMIISCAPDNINEPSISPSQSTHGDYSVMPVNVSQIKKEIDYGQSLTVEQTPQHLGAVAESPSNSEDLPFQSEVKPLIFMCAACQFHTEDESAFIDHSKVNHKADLCLWCKECDKCFINPGVLVSHIKERSCIKEDMFYRCGEKSCGFETTKGQTFVQHLRHCHKRSPFIFCVYCQKIFTLPHFLVWHMQDDCLFKDKHRRSVYNEDVPSEIDSNLQHDGLQPKITSLVNTTDVKPVIQKQTVMSTQGPTLLHWENPSKNSVDHPSDNLDNVLLFSEISSETHSDHSTNAAKAINMRHSQIPDAEIITPDLVNVDEQKLKRIICPCCNFLAESQSVLEDHYVGAHKHIEKTACLDCCLKFENLNLFLDHFEEHRKGILTNYLSHDAMTKNGLSETGMPQESLSHTLLNDVMQTETLKQSGLSGNSGAVVRPRKKSKQSNTQLCNDIHKKPQEGMQVATVAIIPNKNNADKRLKFDNILISVADADLGELSIHESLMVPYQAAIHNENQTDVNFKSFENLKSSNALTTMKNTVKLKHFFRCVFNNCTFTTDVNNEFSTHLRKLHAGSMLQCCYCLKEDFNWDSLVNHMASKHNNRLFQCSKCFYRASSKYHVQIHINAFHFSEPLVFIHVCKPVKLPSSATLDESEKLPSTVKTLWPYICAIGQCYYSTYDPEQFKRHNETVHIMATEFYCQYCKVDFLLLKRLMNHYRLHGLNLFQCSRCIHGTESKKEIMLHFCKVHPDEPLKIYMRASKQAVAAQVKELNFMMSVTPVGTNLRSDHFSGTPASKKPAENKPKHHAMNTGCENELYHVIDNVCYPGHLRSVCFPRYLKNLLSDLVCGVSFCNEMLSDIHSYISHLNQVHKALNFPCCYCPEMFDSWVDFKNHLLCHGSKLYACGTKGCEFYDWNKQKVKVHKKEHENAGYSVFSVREYSEEEDEGKLNALTVDIQFPNVKEVFFCLFCEFKSSGRNVMKNHLYQEMAYQRFDCSLCEKRYLSRKEIKDHFIISHPDSDIICTEDCNIKIETVVKLILMHQGKLIGVKLQESCGECKRTFRNWLQLQRHLYICLHKKYRPYECHLCKKSYVNLLALKYHTDKEHHPNPVEYSLISSFVIEEIIERTFLTVRLSLLKDICKANDLKIDYNIVQYMKKIYTCSVCPYENFQKFNVERHITKSHEGNATVVKEYKNDLDAYEHINTFTAKASCHTHKENSVKRYCCGYCTTKRYTVQELEKHIRRTHTIEHSVYFYYYTPNSTSKFCTYDTVYECAYCSCSFDKSNNFILKGHFETHHPERECKVKGFISSSGPQNDFSACGYCFFRVESHSELKEHSTWLHPWKTLKSVGSFKIQKHLSESDDLPNKRVTFGSTVCVCVHCGAAFSSTDQVSLHHKKTHGNLNMEYVEKQDKLCISGNKNKNFSKFYKCEYCRFVSERQFLDQHIATNHRMSVVCSYCKQCFECASKLKEHHLVAHKNLPIKYRQGTTQNQATYSRTSSRANCNNKSPVIPQWTCHNGKKPDPLDFSSLTVNMETSDGHSVTLPLTYLITKTDLFPKVILKDVMKSYC